MAEHATPRELAGRDARESIASVVDSAPAHESRTSSGSLIVGRVDDPAESDADRMAAAVVRVLRSPGRASRAAAATRIVRGSKGDATNTRAAPRVRRSAQAAIGSGGGTVDRATAGRIELARGRGAPLKDSIRTSMEGAFGTDLSHVRVHTGPESDTLNRSLSARAFTTRSDIFFGNGEYQPSTTAGLTVLAHELTHVVQQTSTGKETNRVQRMSVMEPKTLLQVDEPDYWGIYVKWFTHVGAKNVAGALADVDGIKELKEMLDEFVSSGAKQLTPAEIMRREYAEYEVFQALVAGLDPDGEDAEQLDKLLANFIEIGETHFDYTMSSTDKTKFLRGKKGGDCNTLVLTFQMIAKDFLGIEVEYKTSMDLGFDCRFTTPHARTIDGKTGNVNGGKFWQFENHYWIEAAGKQYDVLFGKVGIDSSSWIKRDGYETEPMSFGDTQIWTNDPGSIPDRYTTKPPTK